jgi:hypothetical protein
MKMKNNLLLATGCCLLLLAACQSPKEQIAQKWQIESFEAPVMDSIMEARKHSIDTMTTIDTNMVAFFGTQDLDSIKTILKAQMDEYKTQQNEVAKQGYIDFHKNGTAIFASGINVDSLKWELKGKKQLLLSPIKEKEGAHPDTMTIENISAKKLRLKMTQGSNSMFVNLHPFTKEDSLIAADLNKKQEEQMQQQMQQMQQMQQAHQQAQAEADARKANGK